MDGLGSFAGSLFKTNNYKRIKYLESESLCDNNPFLLCQNTYDLKCVFFKYLHVFKAMATLEDYFDLNKRYFSLTNTLIFDEQSVKFDILPKYFFDDTINKLYKIAYQESLDLQKDIDLHQIHSSLLINEQKIYQKISQNYNTTITSNHQIHHLLNNDRYIRFKKLIDEKFNKNILLKLLDYFECRNDKEIYKLVTDDADIPTIFEYILAIIWYEISERQGDILQYMNLSLEANLLPKTHAQGGDADIIYCYEQTKYYPKHDLLIEATLANSTNQRRMELEPVSRHLGDYLLKHKQPYDYTLFISTFLHRNVVADFRSRKNMPYYDTNDNYLEGMKIIPIDTQWLKEVLTQNKTYRELYHFLHKAHQLDIKPHEWKDTIKI